LPSTRYFSCIRLGMEDSRRDHQDHKEQRNNDRRHDPLGQPKLPQENAPALCGGSARPSVTGRCHEDAVMVHATPMSCK
jgi:hypothetical protein